ncbi:unnamed protein product [Symbiodinium microadriaticum]|nr:unnamed protein product [Symbiodinium microadriaticum]
MHETWKGHMPFSCEVLVPSVEPCTKAKFYKQYTICGSPEFFRIEEAASKRTAREVLEVLQAIDPAKPQLADYWEANYAPFPGARIKIHAAHLAASLGSVEVLKWLRERCSPDVLIRRSILETTKKTKGPDGRTITDCDCVDHYTPLLCALWMSQVETFMWILEEAPASVTIRNADECAALHLLAKIGLPDVPEANRSSAFERIAEALVNRKADVAAKSGPLKHRKDEEAELLRNKTALEIAVQKRASFPKQMLHLLTQSYHYPKRSRLFIEVNLIAKANPAAAVQLVGRIKKRAPGQLEKNLREEVLTYVRDSPESSRHLEIFIETLKRSPIAGAKLLELLMGEPRVEDPRRYGLPLFTSLPNREMICTYQPVEGGSTDEPIWEKGRGKGMPWHKEFILDLPNDDPDTAMREPENDDPRFHTDVYEVKVNVLHLPGVLNLKVMSILSTQVWNNWDHMAIFSKIPIRAIVSGKWKQYSMVWSFGLLWLLVLLCALIVLSMHLALHADVSVPFLRWGSCAPLAGSVVMATLSFEGVNFVHAVAMCERMTDIPRMKYVWHFDAFTFINWFALLGLFLLGDIVGTPRAKVLLALNLLLRCLAIISELRANPLVGPLIIAVIQSFAPITPMFTFMGMMFVTFALTFLTLKDEDRSPGYVLLNLFQALFLTDSDGAESISGLDIGHQQTLDFGIEMYTGDGSHLLLIVTTVIMLFATSIFSLVLLNLTIGMYTKFYELQEPLARLGLQQCRARLCVRFALRPSVPRTWLAGMSLEGSKWKTCLFALPFVVIFLASAIFELWSVYSGGLCLCAVLLICQAALLINVDDLDSRHRYLWVCYRSDYSETFYMNQDAEITQLKSELQDAERRQSEEIAKIAGDVRRLEQSVKACCDLLRGKPQDTLSCTPQ